MRSDDIKVNRVPFSETGVESAHPALTQLADYVHFELSLGIAEKIRSHLDSCEICQREVDNMQAPLPFEVKASDPPVSFDSYEDWHAHAEKVIAEEAEASKAIKAPLAKPAEGKPASVRPFVWVERLALAAAILLAGWLWMGRPQPGADGQLRELDLSPRRQVVRTEIKTRFPEGSTLLRLNFAQPTEASQFTAALFEANKAVPIWQAPVKRQPTGMFAIHFEAGFLQPGEFRLELRGDGEALATYDFEITAP